MSVYEIKKEMKELIEKKNNIEKNIGFVERQYWLGGHLWYISKMKLLCDDEVADLNQVTSFLELKKDFEN